MENQKKYLVSSVPHIRRHMSIELQNLLILFALVPCVVCSIVFYGITALLILSVAILSSYLFDMFFSYMILGHFSFKDFSGVITGTILGLIMPVQIPIYYVIIASILSIVIAKVMFGGQSRELVNGPSLGVCVLASLVGGFTAALCAYTTTAGEIVSPLTIFADGEYGRIALFDLLIGKGGGLVGTTSALACIAGAVLLCVTNVYDYYIPILSAVAFVFVIMFTKGTATVLPELLCGSFLFVSVFMLPAHSTSPALWPAKAVYAILFGVLAAVIRQNYIFGEAGVFFCLLLMNVISPLLDMIMGVLFRGRRVRKYE